MSIHADAGRGCNHGASLIDIRDAVRGADFVGIILPDYAVTD